MATTQQNLTRRTPNLSDCRTEHIVNRLSRCLANNATCRYALPAGSTTTYCRHRDNMKFQDMTFLAAPREPVKAITYQAR